MKKEGRVMLAAVGLAVLALSGCASTEVVKKEEPIAPTTQTAKVDTVTSGSSQVKPAAETSKAGQANALGANATHASTLEAIYFDFDRSDLSKSARDILSKNATAMLKTQPGIKIKIEGNCDERGSAEYNLALGERRATSAMQYLMTLGVPESRLSVVSYGKEHPAVQGHDDAARAKNRRDDFVVQQ